MSKARLPARDGRPGHDEHTGLIEARVALDMLPAPRHSGREVTIPYIPGEGVGPEVWRAAQQVFDVAVDAADRRVRWVRLLAGREAMDATGDPLPTETLRVLRTHTHAIKGPLATPIAGGRYSLNLALRRLLGLYACVRPVNWLPGVPTRTSDPARTDVIVVRENTEDTYVGFELGPTDAAPLRAFLAEQYGWVFDEDCALGLKPTSRHGSQRVVRAALLIAAAAGRRSVTVIHKGNVQKCTEGAFRDWAYEAASGVTAESAGRPAVDVTLRDRLADIALAEVFTSPEQFDVIASMNLNGDYFSSALAGHVGGMGVAPGAHLDLESGRGLFEATHGTAPDIAGRDVANPTSLILSGAMMFEHLGWGDVATSIDHAVRETIGRGIATPDICQREEPVGCSRFADEIAAALSSRSLSEVG